MSINIEIWKIFEDDHLATYAFGDLGLFGARAKGKVIILKKTGDIYLVEQTDKSLTKSGFSNAYEPKIQRALTDFRNSKSYPDQKSLPDSDRMVASEPAISVAKGAHKWRNAITPDTVKDKIHKILISFFATSADGFTKLIGAGFIVTAAGRKALVMTAFSNFHLHGLVQYPKHLYAQTTFSELKIHPGQLFPVDGEKIKAVYQSDKDMCVCLIEGISIVPELDIALCAVELPTEYTGPFFSHQLGLDSRPPKIGDEVIAIGFSGRTSEWRRRSGDKKDQYANMTRQVAMRIGKVTKVFQSDSRQSAWPAFETTIPIDPGMYGGPVLPFSLSDLKMHACAVISKDMSPQASFKNFSAPGRSVMAMVWPSVSLPFGAEKKSNDPTAVNNLLGLIQRGKVKDAGEANKKITIVRKDPQTLAISLKS